MSTQLAEQGIALREGYRAEHLSPPPDLVVVGNALSRGNPAVEYVLNEDIPYVSGPAWLADAVLRRRHVLAVSGTHGKTTASALLAWILDRAGRDPGFLIGGVPVNFGVSARLGGDGDFVVEADEYDSAFFDKRSKFVHYRPRTLLINNIEFDHADIFADMEAIYRQFHHLVRTVPGRGTIVANGEDAHVARVLDMGCWTPVTRFGLDGQDWTALPLVEDFSRFEVRRAGETAGQVTWKLWGRHNAVNALGAIAAAVSAGVCPATACRAAGGFEGVRRRMQHLGDPGGVAVYDDFAHHPTAIRASIEALRSRSAGGRILAVLEPRSNTMKRGVHRQALAAALAGADGIFVYRSAGLAWDPAEALRPLGPRCRCLDSVAGIVEAVAGDAAPGDRVLIMSNGGFEGIQSRLVDRLGP